MRDSANNLRWLIRLFPNAYGVDPLRDLVLFGVMPADLPRLILTLLLFAVVGIGAGFYFAHRQLRQSPAQ